MAIRMYNFMYILFLPYMKKNGHSPFCRLRFNCKDNEYERY